MTLIEKLQTISDESIIGLSIRLGVEKGSIDTVCEMIWSQSCCNLKTTTEVVGPEVMEAVIEYVSNQVIL